MRRVYASLLMAAAFTLALTATSAASGVTVNDLNNGTTASGLAEALVGGGVSISNVTLTGATRSAGTFGEGAASIGFEGGIVMSSGKVQSYPEDEPCSRGVEGPNTCYEATGANPEGPSGSDNITSFETPGDEQLSELSGFPTFDASVLEFDFVPQHPTVQFTYVFSSEEYSNYSNTQFNDVFAFYINGSNCALVPGTSEPVSVNQINNGNDWEGGDTTPHHPELFRDNVRPAPSIASQMDGLTSMLTCTATVTPGQSNHMKLAISDASDPILDSAVFIQAKSLVSGTQIATTLTGGGHSGEKITVGPSTPVTDHATLSGAGAPGATGTVTYKVYSDNKCSKLRASAGTVTIAGGTAPPSTPESFPVGTYYWQASYSGDGTHNASTGECGAEVETVSAQEEEGEEGGEADPTTVLTSLTGGGQAGEVITVGEGSAVSDQATLRGSNAAEASGSVTYGIYSDSACTNLVASGGTVTVANGVIPASSAVSLAPGTYYWQAAYGGDAGNLPSKSACGVEIETVSGVSTGCSHAHGAGSFGSGATAQHIEEELSTSLSAKQALVFTWAGGAQRYDLASLTSASCTIGKTARTFKAVGQGQINGTGNYKLAFTLTITNKAVVKLVVKITKQKPSGVVVSFKDSPLAESSEVIV